MRDADMSDDAPRAPRWMTEEHKLFQDAAARFCAREIAPNEDAWRAAGAVDRALWRKAGETGLLGAGVPEAYGGSEGDIGFDAILLWEQGRVAAFGWGVSIHSIVKHYLLAYGAEAQKRRWLPPLIGGEVVPALAMTEPGAGSDLRGLSTRARRDGDDYVIDGSKTFITNGQLADLIVLAVKTDMEAGAKGVSLMLIDANATPGFRRGAKLAKIGMESQDTSELFFDGARAPADALLGEVPGRGLHQMMAQLPWERLAIGYMALGAMEAAIDVTRDYVRGRRAFGQRLMDLQNTRFSLAEQQTTLEVTRAFLDQCLHELIAEQLTVERAAMAKWWATQAQCDVVDACLQLHGGYGYMREYPIAKLYIDSRVQKIYGGANEIMKELIARGLDRD